MSTGHFPAEIGRTMEDSFTDLLFRLGYVIVVNRDQRTSLDIIANFYGTPIKPKPLYPATLLPPFFAPKGLTAFSLKRSQFVQKDVNDLIKGVEKAKQLIDNAYAIEGMVIASNFSQKEKDIDMLLDQNIYCWDGRRLIFYSAKVNAIQKLSSLGPTTETAVEGINNASCLLEIETSENIKNSLVANVVVFIDDHDRELTIGSQYIEKILDHIRKQLELAEGINFDIQVFLTLHVLGIANDVIAENAYKKCVSEIPKTSKVFFPAEYTMFQYGAAPWSILLK